MFPGYFLLSSQTIKNSAFGNTGLLTKNKESGEYNVETLAA